MIGIENLSTDEYINFEKIYKIRIKKGDEKCYFLLGYLYEVGCKDIPPNFNKAIKWYRSGYKEKKLIDAGIGLARVYLYGAIDYEKAFYLLKEIEGDNTPVAYIGLGAIYEQGLGKNKDIERAKFFYKKAYALGCLYGGAYYTKLFFLPDVGNSLKKGFLFFAYHQMIRLQILTLSMFNESSIRLVRL